MFHTPLMICQSTLTAFHDETVLFFDRNFLQLGKRLRQKGCVDLPASTGRTYRAPESQEVVRVEFHDTDPIPYEQPLNVIPAATERNNFSVAESMKLSVGSFHLTIPNGTDPQLLAQTLRIVKELEC